MTLDLPTFSDLTIIDGSQLDFATELKNNFDTILFVGSSLSNLRKLYPTFARYFDVYEKHNSNFNSFGNCTVVIDEKETPGRLVYASTGCLTRDYDDVRRFRDATIKGLECVHSMGCQSLAIACCPDKFNDATFVTTSAALDVNYIPADARSSTIRSRFAKMAIVCQSLEIETIREAMIIDQGKMVMKDIGGGEPEQATPNGIKTYVENVFINSNIKVRVFNTNQLEKEFPLLAAVDRGCHGVDRHRGCMIELEYIPNGPVKETLFIIGKGITYDTGGVDLKVHGMRLMSYDKCGSAAVAGFMKILSRTKPQNLRVVGLMAMARNDIGPAAYVCDEILTARSGVKICIGNTDAEGRMAMADVLCYAKEKALEAPNPTLYTIATLTGHVGLTYGSGYTAAVENGPALKANIGKDLHLIGHSLADPVEISYLRKEDYDCVQYKGDRASIMQCNNLPSSKTERGHIFPAAFLLYVSGLDKHGNDSQKPIPYCHLDIAAAIDSPDHPFMDHPRAAILTTMAKKYLFPQNK